MVEKIEKEVYILNLLMELSNLIEGESLFHSFEQNGKKLAEKDLFYTCHLDIYI